MKVNEEFNQPYVQIEGKKNIKEGSEYYGRSKKSTLGNDSEIVQKGKVSYPKEQSAFESRRGSLEKGKHSYPNEQSAFESKRAIPEKGKISYRDSRYK